MVHYMFRVPPSFSREPNHLSIALVQPRDLRGKPRQPARPLAVRNVDDLPERDSGEYLSGLSAMRLTFVWDVLYGNVYIHLETHLVSDQRKFMVRIKCPDKKFVFFTII